MSTTHHVFAYLASAVRAAPVTVLFGDDAFLKRAARRKLLAEVLAGDEDAPFATFDGENAEWRDVLDEVSTVSLFGKGPRVAVVETGDAFVKKYRDRLEDYVQHPKRGSLLVLEVGQWPRNTRLYKALDKSGLQIECRAPERTAGRSTVIDEAAIRKWLVHRAKETHGFKLSAEAAELLFGLVGAEFGLLDQGLAKLALYADDGQAVTARQVEDIVGGWRAKTVWELVDAAAEGRTAEALQQLDHLLQSGEHPLALYGLLAFSFRRLASATRIYEEAERQGGRCRLTDALVQAGVPHWNSKGLANAERQLKHLGRERAGKLYRWMLETDLALKGTHSAEDRARFCLENLFLRLA